VKPRRCREFLFFSATSSHLRSGPTNRVLVFQDGKLPGPGTTRSYDTAASRWIVECLHGATAGARAHDV
jgi:hypothetical protein